MGGIIGKVAGGLIGGVLGKKNSKKEAQNYEAAARLASEQVAPWRQTGIAANDMLAGALGVGGNPAAAQQGFNNYLGSVGAQGELEMGQRAITGSRAARGILNSGATALALQESGTQLARQNYNNYLSQLGGLSSAGLTAGQTAGQALQSGGNAAAQAKAQGGNAFAGGLGSAFKAVGKLLF